MKKLLLFWSVAAVVAGCGTSGVQVDEIAAVAVSPDGRNEIRLYRAPLAYEVFRDGVKLVAKSPIALRVNGVEFDGGDPAVSTLTRRGREPSPVYRRSEIVLDANERLADFGTWAVRLTARDDGVAYRFETKMDGEISVENEYAGVTVPCGRARVWYNLTRKFGQEETIPQAADAHQVATGEKIAYLPLAYTLCGKAVAVTESDVRDYPVWNLVHPECTPADEPVEFTGAFAKRPSATVRIGGWDGSTVEKGGRWIGVTAEEDRLALTAGTRTFPWRVFVLGDSPSAFMDADIVRALAPAADPEADFSWVKPGKVAWDWWNAFDNQGVKGLDTRTYRRFIDFAARQGVEYVIFDEGWSADLDIWNYNPDIDVPGLIRYANERGVGIILWMAWAQVYGEEAKVAAHFAQLGAKGFKIDFVDRGDAQALEFLERFAAECAKVKMLVDYHGVCRPTGLERRYPNVLNYEGIHGLEQLKWFKAGAENEREMMFNDVAAAYLRMTAGPLDYTPGAMLNYAVGAGYFGRNDYPGSVGTRSRQMAMMVLYEAPLMMLCDSPTQYERNIESFNFMAAVPVTWAATKGLTGDPERVAAVARRAADGTWYAAAIATAEGAAYRLDTGFLGEGEWNAEIFRDTDESARAGTAYAHETRTVQAGAAMDFQLAPGGGFVVRFTAR